MRPLWLISTLAGVANAAYFYVNEGQTKCFVETVPQHQVLTAKYKHWENPGVQCSVEFKNPKGVTVFAKVVQPTEETGKTAYMTQAAGEHKICIVCRSSKWFHSSSMKWELSVDVGDADLATNPATSHDLNSAEQKASAVLARIDAIVAENDYERKLEASWRDTSESVHASIKWLNILQIIVMMGCSAFQVFHLKGFFQSQKLI
eukprot:CAMPEP_0204260882 /NCGR_PEP_ID=MMETSP0468-20130131/6628_1 /ASSEMBLY_ACC=CAM_ASM_000383 /TAXON_ID=2969 /ORGANISM="Oxyrrhis marina" /LENGTH=203 /DNA_ID=CAMNT_0051235367 /DNA_START=14 /DNA_END=625 /DNA_ORIENTATION=+